MNTPKKRKQFTREQLRDAMFAVHDSASKPDAARKFGIPLTTLIRRLRNPFPSPVGNRQRITKNRTLLSKLLKTANLVDVFVGGGAIYVMFQAVISHCIISPTFSRAGMNRFPVGELH